MRYFIYTRLLFDTLAYEKSQRLANEVQIFKHPEFLYSEMPSGYEPDEDPFVYYNGGNRKLLKQADKAEADEDEAKNKPKLIGKVMDESLNLTDSIRIGDFTTIDKN